MHPYVAITLLSWSPEDNCILPDPLICNVQIAVGEASRQRQRVTVMKYAAHRNAFRLPPNSASPRQLDPLQYLGRLIQEWAVDIHVKNVS